MLSHADNMKLCQTGRDTPLGEALRRFWVPVLLSEQLPEPDGPPRRIELMGETFVAFRNTDGIVGILDEQCCHRSASLMLGRVEECGIRCIFHGWKFAVDGTIMDTPNVSDPRFKEQFRAKSYPVREAGGFIWMYAGEKEHEPPFAHWPYFDVPADNRLTVSYVIDECNFVQVGEGLVDSSHLTILHKDIFARVSDSVVAAGVKGAAEVTAPKIEVEETDFGFHYAAMRDIQTENGMGEEARITSFFAPFHYLNANGNMIGIVVPMTDTRTLHHFVWWDEEKKLGKDPARAAILADGNITQEMLISMGTHPDTWHNPDKPNRVDNFRQDRKAMKNGSFSGLPPLVPEDVVVAVSSGAIRDRTKENLAPADIAVTRLYQAFLRLADVVSKGAAPSSLGVDPMKIIGTHCIIPEGKTWKDFVPNHVSLRSMKISAAKSGKKSQAVQADA
jgi:phthalate 4,5-dioxygenase oxygenase subunit